MPSVVTVIPDVQVTWYTASDPKPHVFTNSVPLSVSKMTHPARLAQNAQRHLMHICYHVMPDTSRNRA